MQFDPARGDGGIMVKQYFDSNTSTGEIDRTIRTKLCNFTDLFVSTEVYFAYRGIPCPSFECVS